MLWLPISSPFCLNWTPPLAEILHNIAIAQINVTVGDIDGNLTRIRAARDEAAARGAKLVIFPEMTVTGYPAEDLWLKPAFREAALDALDSLVADSAEGAADIVIGAIVNMEGKWHNGLCLIAEGKILHAQAKRHLPNYGVFDEKRVFAAGEGVGIAEWKGMRLGMMICEDAWSRDIPEMVAAGAPDLLIIINASPYEAAKRAKRMNVARRAAQLANAPLIYVNLVGGQDDILFDGHSFVIGEAGALLAEAEGFKEQVVLVSALAEKLPLKKEPEAEIWAALSLGLADYVQKNNFWGVMLGLSGGIDSAVTAVLAADSLGAENVLGVLLPSPYTSKESNEDALSLARALGMQTVTLPITGGMEALSSALNPVFRQVANINDAWMEDPALGGNLQARLRGILLMGVSNATGKMLLNTSNKSEIAVGYSTLYGDSCGAYSPLKDVYKTDVYALAAWRNTISAVIPEHSLTRAPSAELKPNQKDEDQLPSYGVLDPILRHMIEGRESVEEIIAHGFDAATVSRVAHLLRISEYKRRQSPPGVKVTPMMFGRDRRYPLTNGFKG